MSEIFKSEAVANGVATERKKYVSPEIEVFNLDAQPQLLAQSFTRGAGFESITRGSWDENEE